MYKALNLYKVKAEDWSNAVFAAASDQMDAINRVSAEFPEINCGRCSITYIGEVYVSK